MIFEKSINEIHSFDARYKSVLFRNNNLVIPYLNLGVSNHPLHESEIGMSFIDYSYMVFEEVSYLKVFLNSKDYIVIDEHIKSEVFYFGGDYWDIEKKVFNDMEICCAKAYLQTLDFTKLSSDMWMPFSTELYAKSLNTAFLESFFRNEFMPKNIRLLLI